MKTSARTAILIASAVAIVVLFVMLRPGGGEETTGGSGSSAMPTAPTDGPSPTTPNATGTVEAVEIAVEIEDGAVRGDREYTVAAGERVRIEVQADVRDEVHVHGYDVLADVSPDRPAVITFRADAPGVFEVELENEARVLFRLRVTP